MQFASKSLTLWHIPLVYYGEKATLVVLGFNRINDSYPSCLYALKINKKLLGAQYL